MISIFNSLSSSLSCLNINNYSTKILPFSKTKAACFRKFGQPKDVIKIEELDLPKTINQDEVLVKMLGSPFNPADMNFVEGTYGVKTTQFPCVVGNEGYGIVITDGDDDKSKEKNNSIIKEGTKVIPLELNSGTWQQYKVYKKNKLFKINEKLSFEESSTLVVNPGTGYRLLNDFKTLNPNNNDFIIQNGSTSNVGKSIIQISKQMGIKTINIIRDKQNEKLNLKRKNFLKSIGADFVFTENEIKNNRKNIFKNNKLIKKPKLAFNCVGGESCSNIIKCLDEGAQVITYGGMSKKPIITGTASFIFRDISLKGFWLTRWRKQTNEKQFKIMIDYLTNLMLNKKFLTTENKIVKFSELENEKNLQEIFSSKEKVIIDIQN